MSKRLTTPGFRLGTTSFIYPDHIIPNVEKLGTRFDEIELLIFESHPDEVLPTPAEIKTLVDLKQKHRVSYNVHLPIDISLTDPSRTRREQAVDRIKKVMDRCLPLYPTTSTLHLPFQEDMTGSFDHKTFIEHCFKGLRQFIDSGFDPATISIETLDYPFDTLDDVIQELNLSVCVDVGHVLKYGFDLENIFITHQSRISIIHLHGVDMSNPPFRDHLALDLTPEEQLMPVIEFLKAFTGTLSLEVFKKEYLDRSMDVLGRFFDLS